MVKKRINSVIFSLIIAQLIVVILIGNAGYGADSTSAPEQEKTIESAVKIFNSKASASSTEIPRKLAVAKRIFSDKPVPTFAEFSSPPESFLMFASASDLNWLFKINKVFDVKQTDLEEIEIFEKFRSAADLDGIIEYDPTVSPNAALIVNIKKKLTRILEGPVDTKKQDWNDWFWKSAGFEAFVVDHKEDLLLIAGHLDGILAQEAQPIIVAASADGVLKIPAEKEVLAIGKIVEHQKNFALVKIVLGKKKAGEIPNGSRVIVTSKK